MKTGEVLFQLANWGLFAAAVMGVRGAENLFLVLAWLSYGLCVPVLVCVVYIFFNVPPAEIEKAVNAYPTPPRWRRVLSRSLSLLMAVIMICMGWLWTGGAAVASLALGILLTGIIDQFRAEAKGGAL